MNLIVFLRLFHCRPTSIPTTGRGGSQVGHCVVPIPFPLVPATTKCREESEKTKNYLQYLKLTKTVCLTDFTCPSNKINEAMLLKLYGLVSFEHWM